MNNTLDKYPTGSILKDASQVEVRQAEGGSILDHTSADKEMMLKANCHIIQEFQQIRYALSLEY